MVKDISVNVSFNKQKKIIQCQPQEFAEKVLSCFNIDIKDVFLYRVNKNERYEINPFDIKDLMRIEMILKKDGQRSLRTYFESDSSAKKMLDTIINKLKVNSTLTGQERKFLIENLESQSLPSNKKRKLNQRDDNHPEGVSNKKIQVNISSTSLKDSFAQTDHLGIPEVQVNSEEQISDKLKKLASSRNASKDEVAKLMKKSFPDRRNFILIKLPTVRAVKEQYPLLFSTDEVRNELDRIFYPGKCEEFLTNMQMYSKFIVKCPVDCDDILEILEKSKENAHTVVQKTYAAVVGSIFILTKMLDEEFGFIRLSDYPHGSGDVYPYIDSSCHSLKEVFFDDVLFHIIVEGQDLCEASNLPEAILCLLASFFIFSINYPDSCRRTLTVFEKLFLCANDTTDMDDLTVQTIKLFELQLNKDRNVISKR